MPCILVVASGSEFSRRGVLWGAGPPERLLLLVRRVVWASLIGRPLFGHLPLEIGGSRPGRPEKTQNFALQNYKSQPETHPTTLSAIG